MTNYDNQHCRILCDLIGESDPGLLHYGLVDFLNVHASRLERVGEILSTQTIATLLAVWECHNPTERPYCSGE